MPLERAIEEVLAPEAADRNLAAQRLLRGCWVYQPAHGRRLRLQASAYALGVFLHGGLVWSEVHAVHFVAGDVAVEPLDFRAHFFQDRDRFLRQIAQLRVGQISSSWNFSFDYVLGHEHSPETLSC